MPMRISGREIDSGYAWFRLAVSILLSALGGVGMWSVVVSLPAVQAEFAIARGGASLPFTLTTIGFGVGGVLMGRLSDRFGIVPPVLFGALSFGAGYALASVAGDLTQLALVYGLLIGMFGSAATFVPLMADISRWFERRRGIAVALCASGNYIAGAFWPPVVEFLIRTMGWRAAHLWIGIACVVLMVPLTLLLRAPAPVRGGERAAVALARFRARPACRTARCRGCWRSRGWPVAWRCRCRRCISSPTAATWVMASPTARGCCR